MTALRRFRAGALPEAARRGSPKGTCPEREPAYYEVGLTRGVGREDHRHRREPGTRRAESIGRAGGAISRGRPERPSSVFDSPIKTSASAPAARCADSPGAARSTTTFPRWPREIAASDGVIFGVPSYFRKAERPMQAVLDRLAGYFASNGQLRLPGFSEAEVPRVPEARAAKRAVIITATAAPEPIATFFGYNTGPIRELRRSLGSGGITDDRVAGGLGHVVAARPGRVGVRQGRIARQGARGEDLAADRAQAQPSSTSITSRPGSSTTPGRGCLALHRSSLAPFASIPGPQSDERDRLAHVRLEHDGRGVIGHREDAHLLRARADSAHHFSVDRLDGRLLALRSTRRAPPRRAIRRGSRPQSWSREGRERAVGLRGVVGVGAVCDARRSRACRCRQGPRGH